MRGLNERCEYVLARLDVLAARLSGVEETNHEANRLFDAIWAAKNLGYYDWLYGNAMPIMFRDIKELSEAWKEGFLDARYCEKEGLFDDE
jgi:hypothetical protein